MSETWNKVAIFPFYVITDSHSPTKNFRGRREGGWVTGSPAYFFSSSHPLSCYLTFHDIWHNYKQHWRKVWLSSISTDVDLMSFSVITNSNLPAKEGSRGGWGTGDQSVSFTFQVQCQVILPGISWAIAKNWLRRKGLFNLNLRFLVLSFSCLW